MAARLIAVALRISAAGAAAAVLLSSAWLMARPQSDQQLLDAFEDVTGFGPAYFLGPTERATYEGAVADAHRFTEEARRLGARAREHERFVVGAPAAMLSLACLALLTIWSRI